MAFSFASLDDPRDRREARADILDTPVLPGSIVKTIALVTALERGIITANSSHMCRRVVKADGQTLTCSHPDLKRPLSPAEALAYSCNDFFVSLAPRLPREALNATRMAAGLPPIAANAPMAASIRRPCRSEDDTARAVDMMARLVGAGKDKPVPMRPETKAVVLEGLRGAAEYGTASAFKAGGIAALAKTGTILMPSGAALGLVVALTPAERPTRAIVVAAPGGAGMDAAAIAVERLADQPKATTAATIRLGRTLADGKARVETLNLDDYIAQVLAGEGQPRAGDAAQQALAITARTFALANRNRHRSEGYDLCDTTHCQVLRAATAITRRAAESTSGRVLLHQGQPAFVFYSAWCGGKSELASQVWPGAIDYSYEPALHDEACEDEPGWDSEVRVGDIERALRAAGLRGSRLRNLRVVSRNTSGRVATLLVEGFTPAEISGNEFRMAVGRIAGWQSIKSTAFEIDRTGSGYRFKGRGFGHGVGLCVIGAGRRASTGSDRGRHPEVLLSRSHDRLRGLPNYDNNGCCGVRLRSPNTGELRRTRRSGLRPRRRGCCLGVTRRRRKRAAGAAVARAQKPRRDREIDGHHSARAHPHYRASVGRELRPRHRPAVVGLGRHRRRGDRSAARHHPAPAGAARSHDPP